MGSINEDDDEEQDGDLSHDGDFEEQHEGESSREHSNGPRLVAHRTLGAEREISTVLEQMEGEFRSLQSRYSDLVLEAESVGRRGSSKDDQAHRNAVHSMEQALARLLAAMQRKGSQLARLREAAERILEARERLPVADPRAHRRKVEALRTFQHLRAVATKGRGRAREALTSASTAVSRARGDGGRGDSERQRHHGGVGAGPNPARGWAWAS